MFGKLLILYFYLKSKLFIPMVANVYIETKRMVIDLVC